MKESNCFKYITDPCRKASILNGRDEQIQKPPVGIVPEKIWKETRLKEIKEAIERYVFAKKDIPHAWISEHDKLCLELLNGE